MSEERGGREGGRKNEERGRRKEKKEGERDLVELGVDALARHFQVEGETRHLHHLGERAVTEGIVAHMRGLPKVLLVELVLCGSHKTRQTKKVKRNPAGGIPGATTRK